MSGQSHSSIVVKFRVCKLFSRLVGFLLFLRSFLVTGPKLLTWCFFCFPGETLECCKASSDSKKWFMEVHVWEHLIFPPISDFYRLKKIFGRRTWVCGLIMTGQGEFYIMVFHWCRVKRTCDVSGRYSTADIGITFTVSASLPMMRPTVDILFIFRIQTVESIASTMLYVSRPKGA